MNQNVVGLPNERGGAFGKDLRSRPEVKTRALTLGDRFEEEQNDSHNQPEVGMTPSRTLRSQIFELLAVLRPLAL
ncbi:unnamed protein product [Bursaphelenchus xylophilus]|uniref:(pine wood nematode) hypothetical protein n=1 Tax=Bursaphelenchus xylophilus TaxID=6326 RepID=A0A1I7RIT6_BURXY|nr:unnamed protein product [Bursaphelenchus xylophilus]CAG9119082.1 unnamed protein product [Bursaphelenchus xylophilus]